LNFRTILITGCNGFVGPWVLTELRQRYPEAVFHGASRRLCSARLVDDHHQFDLRDRETIRSLVAETMPDALVHLAGLVRGKLDELLAVNAMGLDHLLGDLQEAVPEARVVVVGSSAELGRAGSSDVPLSENTACEPVNWYGVSKLAQSAIAFTRALGGQHVVRLRPFNVFGPGAPESSLAGRCARLLSAACGATEPSPLMFGPLDTRRDYVDVRDLARAVALALDHGMAGAVYHIGSGQSRSGRELVETLIEVSGIEDITYAEDPSAPAALVPFQTAEVLRAREELQWEPQIGWGQSLRDLWDFHQRSVPVPS
jgi:GDP-4-dehydro-6-deoxy-D-mannose reductase